MLANLRPFLVCQPAGLIEESVRYTQFSDVVQKRGSPKHGNVGFAHIQHARNEDSGSGDTGGVPVTEWRLGVDELAEGFTDAIERGLAGFERLLTRLQIDDAPVGGFHIGPQSASF